MPQVGRVIIQDDVEIGANTTIDRGAIRDTVIGEGTKIDNLVQIAHNVEIGRHCVHRLRRPGFPAAVDDRRFRDDGRAGSGIADNVTIGDGAQIAAGSGVHVDVPAGEKWGGTPAEPAREWFKGVAALRAARASAAEAGGREHGRGSRGMSGDDHRGRRDRSEILEVAAAPLSVPDGRPHHRR